MPRFDRTGPLGAGSGTGRGRGLCRAQTGTETSPGGPASGRRGQGKRFSGGRARIGLGGADPAASYDETKDLRARLEQAKEEIAAMESRLALLEKEK
jgi:hypothetical protein